jgi:hypothetical protein
MKRFIYPCVFLMVAVGFFGCDEENKFPPEPIIHSATFVLPERNIVFRFTDGDGNVGLGAEDIQPPFNALEPDSSDNRFHYNLWVNLYRRIDGNWELVETPSTLDFRILDLTPEGQNKQIDARVTYQMDRSLNELAEPGIISSGDTIRFTVQVVDRDLNVSPIVTTEAALID